MTPRTTNIVCAKAPRKTGCVPAVRHVVSQWREPTRFAWTCSYCGARVKVVA